MGKKKFIIIKNMKFYFLFNIFLIKIQIKHIFDKNIDKIKKIFEIFQ